MKATSKNSHNFLVINTAGKIEILLKSDKVFYCAFQDKIMASAELLPKIERLLTDAGIKLEDLDSFGCVTGPGSFTGIRIGVSTIRALSYALNKPAVGVTYFEVLSYNSTAPCTVAIDGTGGVCYLQNFYKNGRRSNPECVRNEDILGRLKGELVCGDNFSPYTNGCILSSNNRKDLLAAYLKAVKKAGLTAGKACAENKDRNYSQLIPLYLRRPQPEREKGEL